MLMTRKDFHLVEHFEYLISKARSAKNSGMFADDASFNEEIDYYQAEIRKILSVWAKA